MEERFGNHPEEVRKMDTTQLRDAFAITDLMRKDEISFVYSHYDRMITGGAVPTGKEIVLNNYPALKSDYFLERREMGIINVGGKGTVEADGESFELDFKEALYLGKQTKNVFFSSLDKADPAKFYINSAPAHHKYPAIKVTKKEAEIVTLGSLENSNHRTINKLLVAPAIQTCQLQMGMTELKVGSVWNTMPAHTHDRRMEVYFYFEIPEKQSVCHFMGEPQESRHIWMQNEQAVISPPWSIHAGAGTGNYTFIWGMAGENLDYGDMDLCEINDLK